MHIESSIALTKLLTSCALRLVIVLYIYFALSFFWAALLSLVSPLLLPGIIDCTLLINVKGFIAIRLYYIYKKIDYNITSSISYRLDNGFTIEKKKVANN